MQQSNPNLSKTVKSAALQDHFIKSLSLHLPGSKGPIVKGRKPLNPYQRIVNQYKRLEEKKQDGEKVLDEIANLSLGNYVLLNYLCKSQLKKWDLWIVQSRLVLLNGSI